MTVAQAVSRYSPEKWPCWLKMLPVSCAGRYLPCNVRWQSSLREHFSCVLLQSCLV